MVDLLPLLSERGHCVSLLLFDGTRTPFYKQLEGKGVTIHTLAVGSKSMHNPLLLFRLKIFLNRHSFDIIHTHNTPCQLLVATAGRGDACYVTTEHNTDNRRRKWRWYRAIDRWMYGKYDHVICVSADVRNCLLNALDNGGLNTKTSVVCNGIDCALYVNAKADGALSQRHRGKHLIVMVAAFRPQKDQATLLRAMCLLGDNYSLMLLGDGPCRAQCETLARTLGVSSRVSFVGIRTDIPRILATADVVVLSSNYEGLSLSCIEGMASGRPFIASDVDGLRDIVNGAGLLFPIHDEKTLAQLISRCCHDKAWAEQVGRRCRERASHYDIHSMADAYEKLYKELTKS